MVPPKREMEKQKRSNLKMDALKWLSHVQLHGANRLASRESRWFWIPSMIFLLIFAGTLLYLIIIRYLNNPTYILVIDTQQTDFEFPSVIIYPGLSFRTHKKHEFISKIKYPEHLNESYVREVIPQLAAFFSKDVPFKVHDLENLEELLQYNNFDVETAGRQLIENCDEVLIRCRWDNFKENCSELFRFELASDGFCCVFNGRSLRREMLENVHKLNRNTTLYYTDRVGFASGLVVAINQTQRPLSINLSYKWIALQAGQRFVDPTLNGTALNPGTEQWVAYLTQSTYITEAAKRLGAFLRRCAMSGEELKYFPNYKRRYCRLECEMATTIKHCGCVRLTHPKPRGVAYCNARRLTCALRVAVNVENCLCLPTCDVSLPVTRISSFALDPAVPALDKFYKDLDYNKVTVVRIFIQKYYKKSNQRSSYYSYVDFFSQLGGMFNMFFGCSILTLLGLMRLVWRITTAWWAKLLNKQPRRKLSFHVDT